MKMLFIGTVEFSYAALKKLLSLNVDIVGVATKVKSAFNADFVDLTPLCEKNNLPFRHIQDINDKNTVDWIQDLKPDVIFCFGWLRRLKSDLLNLAPLGVLGYHSTALPANRGRHPTIWALVLGLEEKASTFFFMDEGADSGDILSQRRIEISKKDDAGTLYQRMIETALEQMEEFVPWLASGDYQRIPQDHSKASDWRKRGKRDGRIDWRISAISIHNFVRGLTKPYVGAHFELEGDAIELVYERK